MATLTVQKLSLQAAGVTLTKNAANAVSDKFANNGKTYLLVENGSGASVTLTITTPQTVSGAALAVNDMEVTVAAAAAKIIGPFPVNTFNDSSGDITISVSLETSVTYVVFSVN